MTKGLLPMLSGYVRRFPEEVGTVRRVEDLVTRRDDCLLRTCRPGHLTASAWVVTTDGRRHLLVRHRKLGRWLQPGGHADGEADLLAVAQREVAEETGLLNLEPWSAREPLDVDVHQIPAHGSESAHDHHDIRWLLLAPPAAVPRADHREAVEVRWFQADEILGLRPGESVLRLLRKALSLIEAAR